MGTPSSMLSVLVSVLLLISVGANSNWFDWDWGMGHGHHPDPHVPHVHIPPQKSVCDKLVFWMDILGHNNSYNCKPLPSDIHGVVHEFCNIAGVETFNNCKEEKQQRVVEDCLDESLGAVESSDLFNRCLCHGYLENYAAMWMIWKMMCEDPHLYHGHSHYPHGCDKVCPCCSSCKL